MKNERNHSIKLGLLITVALAIFIVSIYYLGRKQSLFQSVIKLYATVPDVKGLLVGNNVRFSGINVGTVSRISILNDSTILIEFSVNDNASSFIRKDSKISIDNEGIMGNKILVINPGKTASHTVENKDTLESFTSTNLENMISETKEIVVQGQMAAANMAEITDKVNKGDGDLARIINQSAITNKIDSLGNNAMITLEYINTITGKIKDGTGDLGALVNENQLTEKMEKILIKLDSVSLKADEVAYQLSIAANTINNGNGLIHRLIYDSVFADNIDTTIVKINSGIDDVVSVAGVLEKSWVLNLFKRKNER